MIEAVRGHRPPRLVRTYQKHGYVPEARAALETWGVRLARILAGKEGAGAEVLAISSRAR